MLQDCKSCYYSGRPTYDFPCNICTAGPGTRNMWEEKGKSKTNADKIRSMSDIEMQQFLCSMLGCRFCPTLYDDNCEVGLLAWLKQTAEDDEK